jgi:hypothetical protein
MFSLERTQWKDSQILARSGCLRKNARILKMTHLQCREGSATRSQSSSPDTHATHTPSTPRRQYTALRSIAQRRSVEHRKSARHTALVVRRTLQAFMHPACDTLDARTEKSNSRRRRRAPLCASSSRHTHSCAPSHRRQHTLQRCQPLRVRARTSGRRSASPARRGSGIAGGGTYQRRTV